MAEASPNPTAMLRPVSKMLELKKNWNLSSLFNVRRAYVFSVLSEPEVKEEPPEAVLPVEVPPFEPVLVFPLFTFDGDTVVVVVVVWQRFASRF